MGGQLNLEDWAEAGRLITVKVAPNAARTQILLGAEDGVDFNIRVTVLPEDGKANAAVVKLLAKSLGIAKSRLELVRGATARVKVFRVL